MLKHITFVKYLCNCTVGHVEKCVEVKGRGPTEWQQLLKETECTWQWGLLWPTHICLQFIIRLLELNYVPFLYLETFFAACNVVQCLLVREGKTHRLGKSFYLTWIYFYEKAVNMKCNSTKWSEHIINFPPFVLKSFEFNSFIYVPNCTQLMVRLTQSQFPRC